MLRKLGCGVGLAALALCVASVGACGGDDESSGGASGASGSGGSGGDASATDAGQDAVQEASPDAAQEAADDAPADVSTEPPVDAPEDTAPDVPSPCAAPSDASKRALCIFPQPESIQPLADPALDCSGIMLVQIFDTPTTDLPDGGQVQPLAMRILPEQDAGTNPPLEMSVFDPVTDLRFEDLPATVYVRVLFFDNLEALGGQQPEPGIWFGGIDMTSGLFAQSDLAPVHLTVGVGTMLGVPLVALRRLRLWMHLAGSTQPLGDGQGPAGFILLGSQQVGQSDGGTLPAFGMGVLDCGDIASSAGVTMSGIFVGDGPYYPFGFLDDYGKGMDNGPQPGTIIDLDTSSSPPTLPASSEIAIPSGAYSVDATLVLNFVMPFSGQPDPDAVSCAPVGDAGTGMNSLSFQASSLRRSKSTNQP